ncbi:MAG: DUF3971 domain-containing protein, partial [Pseudomonadota bacterium]
MHPQKEKTDFWQLEFIIDHAITSDHLYKGWPDELAQDVRTDLPDIVTQALIRGGYFQFDVGLNHSGDFEVLALDGQIKLEDAVLEPLPNLILENIDGKVNFSLEEITFDAYQKALSGLQKLEASGRITEIGINDYLQLDLQIESSLSSIFEILPMLSITSTQLQQFDMRKVEGEVKSNVALRFPIEKKLDFKKQAEFKIQGQIIDYKIHYKAFPMVFKGHALDIVRDADHYKMTGDSRINIKDQLSLDGHLSFVQLNGDDRFKKIEFNAPFKAGDLKFFDLDPYIKNDGKVSIVFDQTIDDKAGYQYQLNLDMTENEINIPQFKWSKKVHQKAILSAKGVIKDDMVFADALKFETNQAYLSSSLRFADDQVALLIDQIELGNNKFKGQIHYMP